MERRILFIAHDAGAYGANQSLMNMVSSLKSNGFFVLVVFPNHGLICDLFDKNNWEYAIINYRIELCPEPKGIDFLKNIVRSYRKNAQNLDALRKLGELADANEINIIHSNSSVVSIGLQLAKEKKIKHVWHLREYVHPNYNLFVYGGLKRYKRKIQDSDKVIAITADIAKYFNVSERALVLKDAVRKEPMLTQPSAKENYFLFCGALHKNKGIEQAIMAFDEIFKVSKEYKLLVVGSGTSAYEEYLKDMIKNLGLTDFVDFLGFRNDIDNLMAKATAFLMCSRNEALGRVTIEAMLNFCVVFGYNDSGTSEIIEHSKTGFLYNTTEELVGYMKKIINNPEQFNDVRAEGYKYAVENFLENRFGAKLIDFYKGIK